MNFHIWFCKVLDSQALRITQSNKSIALLKEGEDVNLLLIAAIW